MEGSQPILVPFLKWAGGKRWLLRKYTWLLPSKIGRYIEPFLGSGAVFFHVRPKVALLADSNAELVNLFCAIRDNAEGVRSALQRHSRNHSDHYYYEERARVRRVRHERAAQFLYLNRTCWNGLYRVNLQGEFNVPRGTKDAVLLDTDNFAAAASALSHARIVTSDFEPILADARCDDFVFLDPPYVTRHNFNGFAKYNDKIFSWKDQERLAEAIHAAARRGARILLTNADHGSVRALYRYLGRSVRLDRKSVLAASSSNRGQTTEIAIAVNYEPDEGRN